AAPSEQELVSVILTAGPRAAVDATMPAGPPDPTPDVSAFGAELRQLATGTLIVTLAQREGAATDLALRAPRCALRLHELRPASTIVLATGLGIARRGVHIGEADDRAAGMLRAAEDAPGGEIHLDEVTAGLLDARFHVSRRGAAIALDGEEPTIDPTRPL